jgi:hypothetical protein
LLADSVVEVDRDYSAVPDSLLNPLRWVRRTRRVRRAYPLLFGVALRLTRTDRWETLEYQLEGLQALRYRLYLDILERAADVDEVMLTDVRDVIFQGDPFAEPIAGLELFLEDDSVRIGYDHFNTRWIRELYGRGVVEQMSGRVVSCSGTVFGSRTAMLGYLAEMATSIGRHRRPMGSRDQAVHNALLYRGRLDSAAVFRNGRGRVLTLGGITKLRTNTEGFLVNEDGRVPPVVHQWDRHAPFVSELEPFRYLRNV